MDMNTIEAVVRTADPADWRDGDAWLAGGTVLFSYGSFAFGKEPLRRLLDLGSTGWPAITVSEDGHRTGGHLHRRGAVCPARRRTPAGRTAAAWPGAGADPAVLRFVCGLLQGLEHVHRGRQPLHLPAGRTHDLALRGAGRRGHGARPGRRQPHASRWRSSSPGTGATALAPGELLRSIHLPAPALASRVAFRRLSLSNLGRSGVLLIGQARRRRHPGPHRHRRHQAPRAAAPRQRRQRCADSSPAPDSPPRSTPPSRTGSTTTTSTGCRPGART